MLILREKLQYADGLQILWCLLNDKKEIISQYFLLGEQLAACGPKQALLHVLKFVTFINIESESHSFFCNKAFFILKIMKLHHSQWERVIYQYQTKSSLLLKWYAHTFDRYDILWYLFSSILMFAQIDQWIRKVLLFIFIAGDS